MSFARFSINTNLKTTTSPLTEDFLTSYLTAKGHASLPLIASPVMAAAAEFSINATYIAAHAILESAWGRSRICLQTNNLFGWTAFDDSPYESAKRFPSFKACIEFVMGRIDVLYLTPGGRFFRRAPCLGRGNPDKYGMNANYATDTYWGANIARVARQLESAFLDANSWQE